MKNEYSDITDILKKLHVIIMIFKNLSECSILFPILNRWQLTLAFLPDFFLLTCFSINDPFLAAEQYRDSGSVLGWKVPWRKKR